MPILGPENPFGGGGGFTLGPPQNVFIGADRAAAESARDTYFAANTSNLTSYNDDTSLNIRLEYSASGNAVALFQVRNGEGDAWLDNNSAIGARGEEGPEGPAGPAGGVTSVNTQTGDVVLDTDDISDSGATNKYTTQEEIDKLAGIATGATANSTEQIQDIVGAMFLNGTHNGIVPSYNDQNGTIGLNVTGTQPPASPGASVSNFSIDIASTVDTNTILNNQRQITFTTGETSQIATLNLIVTTGDDQTLTVPTLDGTHTQSVTLSGIDTSTAGTVTFQIRGTDQDGMVIMSNVQTVTIRARTQDELAYYAVRPTDDFSTVAISSLSGEDVQPPASQYTIAGSWPATHVLGILEPTDRPISQIVETAFNRDTLSRWTRTANARVINGQAYDLLTLTNNGVGSNFEFRVTHA